MKENKNSEVQFCISYRFTRRYEEIGKQCPTIDVNVTEMGGKIVTQHAVITLPGLHSLPVN